MKDFEQIAKNFRDPENNNEVMIPPRNCFVNPPKAGHVGPNTTFGGKIPYIVSYFDRPKELAHKERLAGAALMQDKPFSQKAKKTHLFNSMKNVIGEDVPIPERPVKEKSENPMKDERAFKPSHPPRAGNHGTLAPFPYYKEDPRIEVTRKLEVEDEKKPFKTTHNSKSTPMPSITTNMRNLKASFPSVFKR